MQGQHQYSEVSWSEKAAEKDMVTYKVCFRQTMQVVKEKAIYLLPKQV